MPWRRTLSSSGGTCTSAHRRRPARGRTRAAASTGTSCRRLPEHLVESFAEPVRVAALCRFDEARPHDEHVVVTGGDRLEPRAPELAKAPFHPVSSHRRTDTLRNGEPEPRLVTH